MAIRKQTKEKEYTSENGLKKVEKWLEEGATLAELCHLMGIERSYLTKLRQKHEALNQVIVDASEKTTDQVEAALFKTATGYTTENGEYIRPAPVAQIFWLKNKRPDEWKDQRQTELSGSVDIAGISTEIEGYLSNDTNGGAKKVSKARTK